MSEYLKIVLQNLEPMRIADDSASQSGQTVSLRYIPGTALRGVVVNALAKDADFEAIKKTLFSLKVRYLNAFLTDGEQELLPSPKGFYEDKTEANGRKEIQNVVVGGEFPEGQKRAALGRFCRIEGGCVYYYNVDTGSDMKIKINLKGDEKQNVFRSEHLAPNHIFTGYIAVEEESLKERIKQVFADGVVIGNRRSAGLGKCRTVSCEYVDRLPYQECLAAKDQPDSCYMMLLSNTVMRGENGELCGLDCKRLEKELGVEKLGIRFCSTSTVTVRGYNSSWGVKTPSAVMYEQGSVFHLEYQGILTAERMRAVCDRGIGIRRGEGFGRVLFLDDYEQVRYKEAAQYARKPAYEAERPQSAEDEETLRIAAKGYYRNMLRQAMNRYVVRESLPRGAASNGQLGTLESYATAYRHEPEEAERVIRKYLEHADNKADKNRVQKDKNNTRRFGKYILRILDTEIEELLSVKTKEKDRVMGISKKKIFTSEEMKRMKLDLIVKMIRYAYKKEEM